MVDAGCERSFVFFGVLLEDVLSVSGHIGCPPCEASYCCVVRIGISVGSRCPAVQDNPVAVAFDVVPGAFFLDYLRHALS